MLSVAAGIVTGLLGGVTKEGDSGVLGALGGSLNWRGGEVGVLRAGILVESGGGIGLKTGCGVRSLVGGVGLT